MIFFIQDLHLNFHSFLGFQRGSDSSVNAIMLLSATLPFPFLSVSYDYGYTRLYFYEDLRFSLSFLIS